MTHDFAKKPRTQRPNSRPKKTAPKTNVPGWVWLFTGTVLGAFIMFLAYLSDLTPSPQANNLAQEITGNASKQASKPSENTMPKPRFDFYKLLKESEVVIPKSTETKAVEVKPQNKLEYLLQVGSFKNPNDADRLRAELILLNLNAKTEKVTVRNGETWHRVLVGPFTNSSKLAKARSVLASNNLNTLLLKRKIRG